MIYRVGKVESSSKDGIQKRAKEILYEGQINSILEDDDFKFMKEYFSQFHNEWKQKEGVGLKLIRRVVAPSYNRSNRAFWIERVDGTDTDISYIIPNIQKKNYNREFRLALRTAVDPQIIKFKNAEFENRTTLICPIKEITIDRTNCHVDHFSPTFEELVVEFIKAYKIVITPDLFPKQEDNQFSYIILDENINTNFYQFHLDKAKLRIVSIDGNLGRKRK